MTSLAVSGNPRLYPWGFVDNGSRWQGKAIAVCRGCGKQMFAAGVLPGRSISFLSDFVSVAYRCHATPFVSPAHCHDTSRTE